jgi:hypothetical protein
VNRGVRIAGTQRAIATNTPTTHSQDAEDTDAGAGSTKNKENGLKRKRASEKKTKKSRTNTRSVSARSARKDWTPSPISKSTTAQVQTKEPSCATTATRSKIRNKTDAQTVSTVSKAPTSSAERGIRIEENSSYSSAATAKATKDNINRLTGTCIYYYVCIQLTPFFRGAVPPVIPPPPTAHRVASGDSAIPPMR